MRRTLAFHAAIAAILAIAILPAGAAADGKGKRDLRLVATVAQEEFLDHGDPGPSLGDEIVFSEVLRSRGREAGTSGGVCTITEVVAYEAMTLQCVVTLDLRRGQVTLQGLVELQGMGELAPSTIAITGGTGAYRGASGEARVREARFDRVIYKLDFDSDKKHKKKHRH